MTKIEWTWRPGTSGEVWNPVAGCSVVSPGCKNCYAMRLAGTRLRHTDSYKGLTRMTTAGPVWTGELRLNGKALMQPLHWKKPRTVFVNSMSDLFHEDMPITLIDQVFAIMGMTPQHTYQILTKRPARMRDYCKDLGKHRDVDGPSREAYGLGFDESWFYTLSSEGWYLPNVWLGTSVEDQRRADERVPVLLDVPAAVLFLSCEPLLGPVDLGNLTVDYNGTGLEQIDALHHDGHQEDDTRWYSRCLDWVIVGGESGPKAREMKHEWARALRDQCAQAKVPFFMKQMARKQPIPDDLQIRSYP